jgi:hypothetical protein
VSDLKFAYFGESSRLWKIDGLAIVSIPPNDKFFTVTGNTKHLTNFAILLGDVGAGSSSNRIEMAP